VAVLAHRRSKALR